MLDTKRIQLSGKAIPIRGDDLDTDQIIPARFLKEITFEKMGDYLFYDARFDRLGIYKAHRAPSTRSTILQKRIHEA